MAIHSVVGSATAASLFAWHNSIGGARIAKRTKQAAVFIPELFRDCLSAQQFGMCAPSQRFVYTQ